MMAPMITLACGGSDGMIGWMGYKYPGSSICAGLGASNYDGACGLMVMTCLVNVIMQP
jgi:hypothetical protein